MSAIEYAALVSDTTNKVWGTLEALTVCRRNETVGWKWPEVEYLDIGYRSFNSDCGGEAARRLNSMTKCLNVIATAHRSASVRLPSYVW